MNTETKTLTIEKIDAKDLNMPKLHQKFWDSNRQNVFIAVDKRGDKIAQVSIAYNKAGNAYCYFYAKGRTAYVAGIGRAAGYGYCKRSAAAYEAMSNAGIKFNQHFAGAGLEKVRQALELIARTFAGDEFLSIVEIY